MKSENGGAGSRVKRLALGRIPISLLVTGCAIAAAVALSVAIRLSINPANEYDALRRDADATLSPGKSSASLGSSGPVALPGGGIAPETQSPETRSRETQVQQPSGDLIAAIKKAQAERGVQPASLPAGHSWQGMSPAEAAKTFEDAVRAASASSAVSPFGANKSKN